MEKIRHCESQVDQTTHKEMKNGEEKVEEGGEGGKWTLIIEDEAAKRKCDLKCHNRRHPSALCNVM